MVAPTEFKCEGCKYTWEDKSCVVEHVVEHKKKYFFCLNCDDWIQYKENDLMKDGLCLTMKDV